MPARTSRGRPPRAMWSNFQSHRPTMGFCKTPAAQKPTKSLIAASAFDGTTLRVTKSSQFLNGPFARASTIALARAGPIWGSVSSSVAVAVLRLILRVAGATAVGAAAAGAAGLAGARVQVRRVQVPQAALVEAFGQKPRSLT